MYSCQTPTSSSSSFPFSDSIQYTAGEKEDLKEGGKEGDQKGGGWINIPLTSSSSDP